MPASCDWTDHLIAAIRRACVMEVTAPKPGNVHPTAAFEDVTYDDFVRSADAVAPIVAQAENIGVGHAILNAARATQETVRTNTNLGIILLLTPLAAIPVRQSLVTGIKQVLDGLTSADARYCYEAIRLATPGGLGTAQQADVVNEPNIGLVDAMQLAADRDRIAAQYVSDFKDVLDVGLSQLAITYKPSDWRRSIVGLHLELMAQWPDTLIARKCGRDVAEESARRARKVFDVGWPESSDGNREIEAFDQWLRADGHRRNPGTTADLVAAILFAGLREGVIAPPPELS